MITDLLQLFEYRSLIKILVIRELKARYRGTILGFLWSFFNPFLAMLIYVLVFSIFLKVQMENYSAFLLSGLLPWLWFSSSINEASNSILLNGGLIKRIYMPSEIFPLIYVLSNLMNFLFSVPILLLLTPFFNVKIGLSLLFFPILVFIQFLFTLGIALFVSSLTVRFRDFLYVIPNIVTIWYFITPIMYPPSVIPERFKLLLWVNPFAHLAIAYHGIFIYKELPSLHTIVTVGLVSMVVLLLGSLLFQKMEGSFPEEV